MDDGTNNILANLVFDVNAGDLRFKDVRYLLIRPDTIVEFQKTVEAEVGAERCAGMMMAGGIAGGSRSAARYREEFDLSDEEIVAFMCKMGGEIGWGQFARREFDPQARRLVVEVANSPFAAAYGQSQNGVCHLIQGVLAGLAAGIFGTEVRSEETTCHARGDAVCRFEMSGEAE